MGVTLIEVMVAIALILVGTMLAAVIWQPRGGEPGSGAEASIAQARRHAVTAGKAISARVRADSVSALIRAFPDGRIVGSDRLGANPLSGRPLRAEGVR